MMCRVTRHLGSVCMLVNTGKVREICCSERGVLTSPGTRIGSD